MTSLPCTDNLSLILLQTIVVIALVWSYFNYFWDDTNGGPELVTLDSAGTLRGAS